MSARAAPARCCHRDGIGRHLGAGSCRARATAGRRRDLGHREVRRHADARWVPLAVCVSASDLSAGCVLIGGCATSMLRMVMAVPAGPSGPATVAWKK